MVAKNADTPLTPEQSALVEQHVGLVAAISRGWAGRCRGGIELADLQQAGHLGVIDAARRYDARRDVSFAGFAAVRVRGAICDLLRAHDPLTRSRRQAVRHLAQATRDLETTLGRAARRDELASELRWDDRQLESAREDAAALDKGWAQVQDATRDEMLERPADQSSAFELMAKRQMREQVVEMLDEMPERERLVLSLYYFEELQGKEIAAILGVTESRVSQIHSAALARMRKRMQQVEKVA